MAMGDVTQSLGVSHKDIIQDGYTASITLLNKSRSKLTIYDHRCVWV